VFLKGKEMERQILVADEVAEMLRVDRQRVYELVRKNAIPVIRLGERQYRFDAEAIKEWIVRGGGYPVESEAKP
jgi:excisionase family DNA binding protein